MAFRPRSRQRRISWRPVAAYLSSLATGRPMKLATIRRRLATIGYAHRCAKHDSPADDPAVKATMAGIARTIGSARTKKTALTAALVTKVVKAISAELKPPRRRRWPWWASPTCPGFPSGALRSARMPSVHHYPPMPRERKRPWQSSRRFAQFFVTFRCSINMLHRADEWAGSCQFRSADILRFLMLLLWACGQRGGLEVVTLAVALHRIAYFCGERW
jgi:hypothetical protein